MCGIAGYYNLTNKSFVLDRSLLDIMQKTLKHRGPDGYSIVTLPEHELGIIHRRLSIIDLSSNGNQPFIDEEKTTIVACNGEIYNFSLIRSQLEELGYRFVSNSDNEVLLHAYKEWGISCIDRLEGMFAFMLFDIKKGELYLVRDRIGIKPLYFSLQSGILSFASEIKALWTLPWNEKVINVQGLSHYLTFLATPAPMTLYKEIYKLPAGYYCHVDSNKNVHFNQWYSPLNAIIQIEDQKNESYYFDTLERLLLQSVKKHLVSDVPCGVFLSGGIDSSLLVALIAQYTDQVNTFTISFKDHPEDSEVEWARKVSKQFNTKHHEISIFEKDAFNFFEEMVYQQDEPLADPVCVPLYYVSKLLKDSGVTVVQVGEGSDEMFCGYETYVRYLRHQWYWKQTQRYIPAFARKGIYSGIDRLYSLRSAHRDMLKNWADTMPIFWSGAIGFFDVAKDSLLTYESSIDPDPVVQRIYPTLRQSRKSSDIVQFHIQEIQKKYQHADMLQVMLYLELQQRLPELLLMRVDKMTMLNAVEARVPFLDHTLVEFALNMPDRWKYRNGETKYILKKVAERYLGTSIVYRKKMGFSAPTKLWFSNDSYFGTYFKHLLVTKKKEWSDHINFEVVESLFKKNQDLKGSYSSQLWALQNLLATEL
jgi:asparagine synthase (glutamine-hydrolysing)